MKTEIRDCRSSEVKSSAFGCANCLWLCVECNGGSRYVSKLDFIDSKGKAHQTCKNYTYCD